MNMDMEPKTTTSSQKSPLANSVLVQIERGDCAMRSKYYFTGREWFVWLLWAVTVVVGAVAVALVLSRAMYGYYALYEVTHGTWYEFWLETVPYLWLTVFGVLIAAALVEIRYTNRGYRYPWWTILGSSLVVSVAGGFLLHVFGISYVIDRDFGSITTLYDSAAEREYRYWQQPGAGRLVGTFVHLDSELSTGRALFKDRQGALWEVNLVDLMESDLEQLHVGLPVRVYGTWPAASSTRFHACGVFSWLHETAYTGKDFAENRRRFDHHRELVATRSEGPCWSVWRPTY